jgi:hypothetical protein
MSFMEEEFAIPAVVLVSTLVMAAGVVVVSVLTVVALSYLLR